MKKILQINSLCILLLLTVWSSQAQNRATIIKTQAIEMSRALLNKDKESLAKYIHPGLIAMAGGREETLNRMDSLINFARQFGATVQKILIGNPLQIIQYRKEWQCALPQTTTLVLSTGTIELSTTLIGISADDGQNWYFIDATAYQGKSIKLQLPDISPSLVIPAMKAPKITPKQ